MNNSTYAIAVFSVRTSTLQFNSLLSKNGIRSFIVETPKAVSATCGISVRFGADYIDLARKLLFKSPINNFVRFYIVEHYWGNTRLIVA